MLIDVVEEGVLSYDLLLQALKEALQKGLVLRRDIEAIGNESPEVYSMSSRFKSTVDFRRSLEMRLHSQALATGVDLQRLKKQDFH